MVKISRVEKMYSCKEVGLALESERIGCCGSPGQMLVLREIEKQASRAFVHQLSRENGSSAAAAERRQFLNHIL